MVGWPLRQSWLKWVLGFGEGDDGVVVVFVAGGAVVLLRSWLLLTIVLMTK